MVKFSHDILRRHQLDLRHRGNTPAGPRQRDRPQHHAAPAAPTAAASPPCSRGFGATDCSTAHAEAWASRCSSTIRTARSRTFGENRLGRPIDPILLRNSWVHKFACFEVNEAQAESLCSVTEVAERPGAMLGLIGLDGTVKLTLNGQALPLMGR